MRISLIAFGKLKTPGLREAADYYSKLIQPWVSLDEIELKPVPVPEKSAALRTQIQEKEAEILNEKLNRVISSRGAFYLLDEGGKTLSTRQWAELVRDWQNQSLTEVGFCVGSSLGFSREIRSRARGVLSLGPQTLSHELARVVWYEQIYRAWSVVRGHPYHNEG